MSLVDEIRSAPWSSLKGAYGPSVPDPEQPFVHRDVGKALETLLLEDNRKSSAWDHAIDTMQSHVVHQGSAYAVTAVVLPLLARIIEERRSRGDKPRDLQELLRDMEAATPRAADSGDDGSRLEQLENGEIDFRTDDLLWLAGLAEAPEWALDEALAILEEAGLSEARAADGFTVAAAVLFATHADDDRVSDLADDLTVAFGDGSLSALLEEVNSTSNVSESQATERYAQAKARLNEV